MTLLEILKAQGLNDEQANKVVSEMKTNKIYTTSLENADERYSKLKSKKEDVEGQLTKANTTIESLKKYEKDNEELKGKLSTWETDKANYEKALADKDFTYALDSALKGYKVKNDKLVKALLDREKIKLSEGKLEGLEDQIKAIKEENAFLFEKEKGAPDFMTGGKGSEGSAGSDKPKSIGEKLAEVKSKTVEIKY